MNQLKNSQRKDSQKNKGSLTLEASIILVFFLVAFMAILSVINMYRAQVLIQNAANQTAQEIAQYTYILKKAGLADFGQGASDRADAFTEDTNKTIGTVFAFFEATSNGLDAGKNAVNTVTQQSFPQDFSDLANSLEQFENEANTMGQQVENIKNSAQAMMDAGKEYFKDPQTIFNGILAILKDAACDSVKIAVAAPITKGLMEKYLSAYPADYLEKLGVVGGNNGINYWGSSILLDMQSIEVSATYKMKIDLPFLDLKEYHLKTTASTRAWIGDGTHNDNGGGSGVKLADQATGVPGLGGNVNNGDEDTIVAGGSPWIDMVVTNQPSQEIRDIIESTGFTVEEFRELIQKPFSEYTNEDWAYMEYIRSSIPQPDANTDMIKVITPDDLANYLSGNYKTIGGCVTTASAVEGNMGPYANMLESLRLDYLKNGERPYPDGGNEYFYIEFNMLPGETNKPEVPRVENLSGSMKEEEVSYPQTGNGFLGGRNGTVIPEWTIPWGNAVNVQDGTIIYRVVDGKKQKYAVYSSDTKKFELVN